MLLRSPQSAVTTPPQAARRRDFLIGDSAIIDVVFAMGEAKWPAIKHHAQKANTIVLAFDNPKESAARRPLHEELGVTTVSVGEGQTTYTLFKDASPAKQEASRRRANTSIHTGMGASAVVGDRVSELYTGSHEADALTETVLDKILDLAGGTVELIRLRGLFSIAGATGAGLVARLSRKLALDLSKKAIPVSLELDGLAALAFTGVSPTCRLGAGAVLPSLVDFTTDNANRDFDLVPRRLELSELPPLREKHAIREQLMQLEEQAITSKQFRDQREIVLPNVANQGLLGNIHLRETDYVSWLDPATQVRPAVAAAVYAKVHEMLASVASPDPTLQLIDVWDDVGQRRPRPTVEALAADAKQFEFQDYLLAIEQPGPLHEFHLAFTLPNGSRFDAYRVDEVFCASPVTLDEATWRLHLLIAMLAATEEIIAECKAAEKEIGREQKVARRKLRRAHYMATKGFWGLFVSQSAVQRLILHGTLTRDLADELREWQAKHSAATEVAKKLAREAQKLQEQFEAIERALAKFLPQGPQIATLEYVNVRDPNTDFPALLRLPEQDEERQTAVLCALVETVTLQGLAAMLDTRCVDVDEIARQIVFGPVAFRGPPLGGLRRQSEATVFYALPPMAEPFLGQLSKAISRLRDKAIVVSNDLAGCGAGVLRIRYRSVHSLQEVFVGVLKTGVVEAYTRPDREMLCVGGDQTLNRLGMCVNGDLIFTSPIPAQTPNNVSTQQ